MPRANEQHTLYMQGLGLLGQHAFEQGHVCDHQHAAEGCLSIRLCTADIEPRTVDGLLYIAPDAQAIAER
ncbi:hypothetical protein D3C84_613610 [compost metagenome]